MKAIILQHASFEGPGYILQWLHEQNFETDTWLLYQSEVPSVQTLISTDLLIIMGGPMSVHDEQKYLWLCQEKKFIEQALNRNIPTLGICLGAQLIADVCGAKVSPALHKEIGWFTIQSTFRKKNKHFEFPACFKSFLWHGEQFDIPKQALLLASTPSCPHQAFQLYRNVIGLQFHPEVTPYIINGMIRNARQDLVSTSPYVKSAEQISSVPGEYFIQNSRLTYALLHYLLHT